MDITIPPSEIRTLIGKTATYVTKNGVAFENKIKSKESRNPKFVFLNENDPYHAYYQFVLNGIRENGEIPLLNTKAAKIISDHDENSKTTIHVEKKHMEKEPLRKPHEFCFLQLDNDNTTVSPTDLAVIKLVAQFTVINGSKIADDFKKYVLNDSHKSPQFQFLKENHSKNKIYQNYVNYYSEIWNNQAGIIDHITQDTSKTEFLDKCFNMAEYFTKESVDLKELEEKRLAERIKFSSIDWNDFALVETIEFTQLDEIAELHKPLVKSNLEYRSLVQKGETSLFDEVDATSDAEVEEELIRKDAVEEEAEEKPKDAPQGEDEDETVPSYADDQDSNSDDGSTKEAKSEGTEVARGRKVPKGMKVRAAGESRLMKRKFGAVDNSDAMIDPVSKEKLLRCPLTGKFILESKFQAHISTLLRDPKYEEEKQRYESKFKYGSGLTTDQVYENIQKLVRETPNKRKK